jgi:hypothetical protein
MISMIYFYVGPSMRGFGKVLGSKRGATNALAVKPEREPLIIFRPPEVPTNQD